MKLKDKENFLVIADMEGSAGLTRVKQLDDGQGVHALTLDIQSVINPIRRFCKKIYIWDFDGDENNLKNEFGPKTKILSHPRLKYLASLQISKIFLVGFHAMAGVKNEFCPHTYSGHEVYRFAVNGESVGEATLFAHLFSQLNVPIVFISGSHYACKELNTLKLKVETVSVRKNKTVYDVLKIRKEISQKAKKAIWKTGKIIRLRNYKFDIVFNKPIAHFFKSSHFMIKSDRRIIGSSPHFATLYQDFVNGIFEYWGDRFRF